MSMKFIYCLIFMAAAVLAVSAQEVILAIAPADNGSLNLTANETDKCDPQPNAQRYTECSRAGSGE